MRELVRGLRRVLPRRERIGSGGPVAADVSAIPVADDPADLLPGVYDGSIRLTRCRWRFGHLYNDQALVFLCHLAARGASPIVEFGTFDGRTTYNLALNLPEGQVITIDANVPADRSNVDKRAYGTFVPGEHFLDAEPDVHNKIVFLQTDSRTVDLSPWYRESRTRHR